jgi:hypothetical protein
MDRRQAIAAIGTGSLAFASDVTARAPEPAIKVSIAIPELFGVVGKLEFPPTFRDSGFGGIQFNVVVENVSAADVYLWSEWCSAGYDSLTFEVSTADGAKSVARRAPREWSKNINRAERLLPGGFQVRAVQYDISMDKSPHWEGVPFSAKETQRVVTLRAVFERPKNEGKLDTWAGRIVSQPYKVVLWSPR